MAGTGVKVLAAIIAIPVGKLVADNLQSLWRGATGTEPPSRKNRKEQEKANKEAVKLGLLPRPIEEPKLADALMWSALTAMSVIAVKYVSERGAEEVHRLFVGQNPPPSTALHGSTEIGLAQGTRVRKAV